MTGRLDGELPQLLSVLRLALGIGTGTVLSSGWTGRPSWRGKVVRLGSSAREAIGYTFAVVLTEHRYSMHRRYQLVVPIGNRAAMDPLEQDLVVTGRDWLQVLDMHPAGAVLAVAEVQSLFHRDEIEAWTGVVIDEETLREIEAALSRLFDL